MPFRHTPDFFPGTPEERVAWVDLVASCRDLISREFSPAGYNIGFNVGAVAGQTVMHCHWHWIRRFVGDTRDLSGVCEGLCRGTNERGIRYSAVL